MNFSYLTAVLLLVTNPVINDYHEQAAVIAVDHNLDPGIFRSMIFLESSWDTKAKKGKCFGLGQLKESTASEMAGYEITGEDLIYDPILSLELSACYLAFCKQLAGGDIILALSYYRYGPWSKTAKLTPYSRTVLKIYEECYNQEGSNDFSDVGYGDDGP